MKTLDLFFMVIWQLKENEGEKVGTWNGGGRGVVFCMKKETYGKME